MSLRPIARLAVVLAVAYAFTGCANGSHSRTLGSGSAADAQSGKAIFARECAACHGSNGVGGPLGPPLVHESSRRSHRRIEQAIVEPDPRMPKLYPGRLSKADVRNLTAYVESL